MNTTEKILKALQDALAEHKKGYMFFTDEERAQQDGKEFGIEEAIDIVKTFIKVKQPKKLNSRKNQITAFIKTLRDMDITRVDFPSEGAFTYQYHINDGEVHCEFFNRKKQNKIVNDDVIKATLAELLRKQIKNGYNSDGIEAVEIIDLFKDSFIQIMYIDSLGFKRKLTKDDFFEVEGGSDS